jgi:hypothetical protein
MRTYEQNKKERETGQGFCIVWNLVQRLHSYHITLILKIHLIIQVHLPIFKRL